MPLASPVGPGSAAGLRRTDVLIVDDEERLVRVVASFLGQRGLMVAVASDGAQGLQRVAELRPRVVLLDVMMPGMSGLEVCRHLKAEPGAPAVILFSAALGDSEADKVTARDAGADFLVRKPYTLVGLGEFLSEVLAELPA